MRVANKRVGSGYLLTDRLVLTAYHVVAGGAPIHVQPLDGRRSAQRLPASRCWPSGPVNIKATPERDVALLLIDAAGSRAEPPPDRVRFGEVTGRDCVSCWGLGFPDAAKRADGSRDTMAVRGHVDPLQGLRSGLLTVHDNKRPRHGDHGSGWAGISGGPLFTSDDLLIGVLVLDRNITVNSSVLSAVPFSGMLDLPGFLDTLTAHGVDPRIAHEPLDTYLTAASRAAGDQPYAGVLNDTTPPLAKVYLREQVRCLEEEPGDRPPPVSQPVSLPTDKVLADARTCVVLAGPGGGKSSLLRTWLHAGVASSLRGDHGTPVPVLVPATALTRGELASALAKAVNDKLRMKLPETFFRSRPLPDVPWLVLVDGLDEIPGSDARRGLLRDLAAFADRGDTDLYRFVVATRPLPAHELGLLGAHVPWFDLLPFGYDDVPQVAYDWFKVLKVPDPAEAAKRFVTEVRDRKLTELARVPLLAGLLCQLYATNPVSLPSSRGEIYDKFILELRQLQERSALEYPGGETVAQYIRDHALNVAGHLAAQRLAGSEKPFQFLLESWTEAPPPPLGMARTILKETVLRSGLLTEQAGELVFLQQTFLEYCAAHHATSTQEGRDQEAARLFGNQWSRHWPWNRWGRRFWQPPGTEEASYTGFLLEMLLDKKRNPDAPNVERALLRLARQTNMIGCRLLAEQKRLGTDLPAPVTHAATKALVSLARITDDDRRRADLRAHPDRLDPQVDPALANVYLSKATRNYRVEAAEALGWLGVEGAVDTLVEVAQVRYLANGKWRVKAAVVLAEMGDERGVALLHDLATDTWVYDEWRIEAAAALIQYGDERGVGLLHNLARDTKLTKGHRSFAISMLAAIGHERSADTLDSLAHDASTPADVRLRSAEKLTSIGDDRGPAILRHLAQDASLNVRIRLQSAVILADAGEKRGTDLLVALAQDTTVDSAWRLATVRVLADHDTERATAAFTDLARDPTLKRRHRRHARRAMP
ncbi:trypsin-like peptidase domain-containing protein [Streptomyces sp. NPDC002730]|uniref:trypsin-like peptidase domain-containing protein n=1 Tax=Streptomyces sp. NPDC002730 TaxID=3364662 RepID=UPI0036AE0532